MATSLIDAESLLTVDLGSINTRVSLFDIVEGQYRHIATGIAPTTAGAPYGDVGECFHRAIQNLQKVTGRVIIGASSEIILPTLPNGSGIDQLVITHSAGPELRVIVAGLLPDVSMISAQRLISTINTRIVDMIGITDRRRTEVQLDAIIRAKPDLVIISGGTEYGATRSVLKLVELMLLVCKVMTREHLPEVIFAGNRLLANRVKELLEKYTRVTLFPNIRPTIESENISQNLDILKEVINRIRMEQIGGLAKYSKSGNTTMMPTSLAFGRMIQFISLINDSEKGVLGVDLGSSATTVAAALSGSLSLSVFPYGVGIGAGQIVTQGGVDSVMKWLADDIPIATVRDYLWQKTLFPASVPFSHETLAIEQAAVRHILQTSSTQAMMRGQHGIQAFEPVIVSGAVLTQAPQVEQSLLMLLDGLQPTGITTLILDQNGLVAALGAAASVNSNIPVQVLESAAFLNLGTVVAPFSQARNGTGIMRVKIEYDGGGDSRHEIKQGALMSLPVQTGQVARVHITMMNGATLDPAGRIKVANIKIIGGVCGIVIDARGRPIVLPNDGSKRRELMVKWKTSLGITGSGIELAQ